MKLILIVAGLLLAAPSFAQKVVVIQDNEKDYYALVTSCKNQGTPSRIRVEDVGVGEKILIQTAERRQTCKIQKVVKIT